MILIIQRVRLECFIKGRERRGQFVSKRRHIYVSISSIRYGFRRGGWFGHGNIKFGTYTTMIAEKAGRGDRFDSRVVVGGDKYFQSIFKSMCGEIDMLFEIEQLE